MRSRKVVGMLMGVEGIVVEDLRVDVSREVRVVVVRARRNARGRCPECGARCPKCDHPLVLGTHSVHTDPASLARGGARIREVRAELRAKGRLEE